MRVIKGKFKRRNLKSAVNIRPTSFRIKKAIFDLLGEEVVDAHVLDLFAGSGALGVEALSCGAGDVTFVDIKRGCIQVVRDNLSLLRVSAQAQVHLKDAFKAIRDFCTKNKAFDVVFVDPPYYGGLAKKALQTIDEYDIVGASGYLVTICSHKEDIPGNYRHFSLIVAKNYGQSLLLIYKKDGTGSLSRDV